MPVSQPIIIKGEYFDSMREAMREFSMAMKTIRKYCESEEYSDFKYTDYKIPLKKTCCTCRLKKDLIDFYDSSKSRDGKRVECINCVKIRSEKRRIHTPKNYKDTWLKYTYGISIEDYEQMIIDQNECCAICGKQQNEFNKPLFIDHNHDTGEIRGLLCLKCNSGIGLLNDDPEIIQMALNYLLKEN